MFEKNQLALCVAVVLGLAASMPLQAQQGSAEPSAESKEEQKEKRSTAEVQAGDDSLVVKPSEPVETIMVTGSLIPRTGFDGADPMTVIDAEEMREKGLLTVADVIDSLAENTGYREGGSNLLSGFTVGATEANLRGLGAGRTLVLVNGRRIADYPMPFGGEQNGADLGTIPTSAVSRVEVLSGSASAIYGSDAVGGVINIITVRDMERTAVTSTVGVFEDGYGFGQQTSFITGKAFDRGSVTFSMETFSTNPVFADEVEFLDEVPFVTSGINVLQQSALNSAESGYVSPDGYDCAANGMITAQSANANGSTVCNFDGSAGIAMAGEQERSSMFVDGRYQITDNISAFATVLASKQQVASRAPIGVWQGQVYNSDFTKAVTVQRSFSQDLGFSDSTYDQEMWTLMAGIQGDLALGDSIWNWDIGYSKARYNIEQRIDALREEVVADWILQGAGAPQELATNIYQVSESFYENDLVNNIFRDASADRDSLVGQSTTFGMSSADSFSAKVVGDLTDFGGKLYNPITMAVIADWSRQSTGIDPDERSLNLEGAGWMGVGALEAGGSRSRTAVGAEFLVPVLENLEITLATRMDRYDDSSAIGGRSTSTAKFVYRPSDLVMLRGHWGQTFRAPDMFNIYGESTGYLFVQDLVAGNCFDGEAFTGSCPAYQVLATRRGKEDLKEEKGEDIGFGLVFTPTNDVAVSADWYKVRLDDLVVTESAFDVMNSEWQCSTGALPSGSRFCQDIYDRVDRDASGFVQQITIEPQNQEYREVEGLDIRASARFESVRYGNFAVGMNYVNTLSHDWLRFSGDEPIDLRTGLPGQSLPATRSSFNVSWSNPLSAFKSVGAGLLIQRQGRVDNFIGTKQLEPYYTANLTGHYKVDDRLTVGMGINNLTNAMPNRDETSQRWPYYWSHLQSALGRSVNLSFSYFLSN
ncbi:TonB-dependent receptor domain-containing protein [Microbulbifer elongatus]|uniref:TonB-dependent receptor domain-containing protein n=1 Tax=Microbulbifer elongatus TaxID=86173 RepID=UPI001CFE1382|nr:TonB-dependent receptor [Microbulbifer elongatus]